MPYYFRQQDAFSCGPVGILNALRWARRRVTARLLPRIRKESSCIPQGGTLRTNLTHALYKRGKGTFSIRYDRCTSLGKVEGRLRDGKAVLLCFLLDKPVNEFGGRPGHYVLITGMTQDGSRFRVANYINLDGERLDTVSRAVLRHDLRRRKRDGDWYPIAWYLTAKTK